MADTRDLTPMQEIFLQEYLVDLNATAAAERAGYKHPEVMGSRLANTPAIAAAIREKMDLRAKRTEISADRVLVEIAKIAFGDIGQFMRIDGDNAVLDFSRMDAGATALISELNQEVYAEGRGDDATPVKKTKLKLHDKLKALDMLSRHLGLLTDKTELTGKDGGPVKVDGQGITGLLLAAKNTGEKAKPANGSHSDPS